MRPWATRLAMTTLAACVVAACGSSKAASGPATYVPPTSDATGAPNPSTAAPATAISAAGTPPTSIAVATTPAEQNTIQATVSASTPAALAVTFPLQIDSSRRYLVDAKQKPFQIRGDAGWSLIAQLHREDVITYLDNRHALGFNTVLVSLLEHKFSTNAPNNIYGDPPFTTPQDYSTPNQAYFDYARWVVQQAQQRGVAVLLTPSYLGISGGDEGFYDEMVRNGADKMYQYGRYVGSQFSQFDNIIWVQGGDYNPPDKQLVDALAQGISATDPGALQTAHTGYQTSAFEEWGGYSWLSINTLYTAEDFFQKAVEQDGAGNMPFFQIEGRYESEYGVSTQAVRAEAYEVILGGAFGEVFGNNPIWHFDGPGLFDAPLTWQQALIGPGSTSMEHLHALFDSLPWWTLRPVEASSFLQQSGGADRAVVAVSTDRRTAVVYAAKAGQLVIRPATLDGSEVSVRWYDPSNGVSGPTTVHTVGVAGELLTVPGNGHNAEGSDDWVLVVTAQR